MGNAEGLPHTISSFQVLADNFYTVQLSVKVFAILVNLIQVSD